MSMTGLMDIEIVDGERIKLKKGMSLYQILERVVCPCAFPPIAAKINNRLTNLRHKLKTDSTVEFLDCTHPEGFRVYQSSLCYLLGMAVQRIFPEATLKVEHSLSKGLYCELLPNIQVDAESVASLEREMREFVKMDIPIEKEKIYLNEANILFQETGQTDKLRLFRYSNPHSIDMYHCDDYLTYSDCPLVYKTGLLGWFELIPHETGMILMMPEQYSTVKIDGGGQVVPEFIEQPKLYHVFQEYGRWLEILDLADVGSLNERVVVDEEIDVIRIAEALHEKHIAHIADGISSARIALLAGPSSSGKTTFSKRLADQLRVNGLSPLAIELDNYFLDRENTPRDADGQMDFESLHALDVPMLRSHMEALIQGREISVPKYNFLTGKRILDHHRVQPGPNSILIFEGIHAINPEFVKGLPLDKIRRVYVSPLTTLAMDNQNRVPTTDVRLLRRIVRDNRFRGHDALETLRRWQSVRRGETAYIFPYQKDADFFFNSALVYELAVLKRFAEPLLYRIGTDNREYSEARRLLKFLSYFQDIQPDRVPSNSILREFIGGSAFAY